MTGSVISSRLIQERVSLAAYNTLGFAVEARYFCKVTKLQELEQAQQFCVANELPWLFLGGGSNVVLTEDFAGLVILVAIIGQEILTDRSDKPANQVNTSDVLIQVGAGEDWDNFVAATLQQNLYGLENLSLIPGTVGAAPIQNIGAYGVELADVLQEVAVFDFSTAEIFCLPCDACELGYRDSIFKSHPDWLITHVTFRLNTVASINVSYSGLVQQLAAQGHKAATAATPLEVRQAVIAIRQKKLPDPQHIPNVGSFFKNPVVTPQQAKNIQTKYPDVVTYGAKGSDGQPMVKLAAGWLIDRLGWKGFHDGGVGVHAQQALVLIKHGPASGHDLLTLAQSIQMDVKAHFKIDLDIEPRVFTATGER